MAVADLQAWADNLEVVRLPQIEADISVLQTEQTDTSVLLTQKVQEFSDTFAAHSVRIDVAQQAADAAGDRSIDALTRVTDAELSSRTYTNAEVQALRDYVDLQLPNLVDTAKTQLGTELTEQVDAVLPSVQAELATTLSEVQATMAYTNDDLTDMQNAFDLVLNGELPTVQSELDTVKTQLSENSNFYDLLVSGFTEENLLTAFDNVRAENEKNLTPLGTPVLRKPRSLWGLNVHLPHATLDKATLGNYGTFLTDDPDFGECFVFPAGENTNIGASFPIDYDASRIYKVTVTLKCVDDGVGATSGTTARIGATVAQGTSALLANEEAHVAPEFFTVADGPQTHTVYVSGDQAKLDAYGVPTEEQIHLANTAAGNKLYIHLRQNAGSDALGSICLASLAVTDVTDVSRGLDVIRNELSASFDAFSATMSETYMTAATTDEAISGRLTAFEASLADPTGLVGALQANIEQNYVAHTDLDTALASTTTSLTAEIDAVANAVNVSGMFTHPGQPADAWTDSNHVTGAFPRPAISDLRFITGDADFGECYESTASNATIGPAQAIPFDRSRAYLVRVRVKTIDDGTYGGTRLMIGFSTFNAGGSAVQQSNVQVDVAYPLPAADGVQEYAALIYPSTVGDLGTFSAHTHSMQHSAASDASDLIAFHLRHNAGNETNGKVRVGLIEVKDVTDVLNANISAKASYDAEQAAYAYRDEAGTHAGAANSAKLAAEAAQGQASGFASSASQSASNAATSASTANSAKASAISARDLSVSASNDAFLETITALPSTFEQDGRYFTSETAGAPGVHPLSGWSFKSISGEGRVAYRAASAGLQYLYPSGVIRPVVGRTYRLTVTARRAGTVSGSPHISMFFRELNANYGYVSLLGVNSTNLSDSMADYVLEFSPTTEIAYVRAGFYTRNEATGTGEIRVQSVKLEDVTATAEAEAYKVSAGVSETAAVAAAGEAQDAAAAATFARDVAARVMGGGGNPNPIFIEPVGSPTAAPEGYVWSASNGALISREPSGGKYGACIEYDTGVQMTSSSPYIYQGSEIAGVDLLLGTDVEAVEIDFEIELLSGSWDAAAVWVRWEGGTGGTDQLVTFSLKDQLAPVVGKVQRLQGLAVLDGAFVPGSLNQLRVMYYGNIAAWSTGVSHTARIHRFDYHVVSKSASSLIQQKAIVDLEGNAAASLVFRTKAGTSDGSVEIVSASNPDGAAASKVKLTGDEIEFDGMSVFKDTLQSSNYDPGVLGWYIDKEGNASFNNLVARDWVQDGAVSDGGSYWRRVGSKFTSYDELALIQLGKEPTADALFQVSVSAELRRRGYGSTQTGTDKDGYPISATYYANTKMRLRESKFISGAWTAWETIWDSAFDTNDGWTQYQYNEGRVAYDCDDVKWQLITLLSQIPDSYNTEQNNARRIGMSVRALQR